MNVSETTQVRLQVFQSSEPTPCTTAGRKAGQFGERHLFDQLLHVFKIHNVVHDHQLAFLRVLHLSLLFLHHAHLVPGQFQCLFQIPHYLFLIIRGPWEGPTHVLGHGFGVFFGYFSPSRFSYSSNPVLFPPIAVSDTTFKPSFLGCMEHFSLLLNAFYSAHDFLANLPKAFLFLLLFGSCIS